MKRKSLYTGALVAAAVISSAPLSAIAFGDDQIYVPGEVLVVPRSSMTLQGASAEAASYDLKLMSSHKGGTSFLRLKLKPGEEISSMVNALASQPWVAHVQPNYIYHATALPNDPQFTQYWGLQNSGQSVNGYPGTSGADISAVRAWDETTDCSAITVAVVDTGVDYNHPDLAANIWSNTVETAGSGGSDDDSNGFIDDLHGWDFVQGDNDPMDFNEHGTHVAGTIGAVGNNGVGGVGVCWQVRIIPLRALDAAGSGNTADIVAAVDYAVDNGAKVINMSLGGTGGTPGDLFDTAIANAHTAGVLVVAAAGNDGTNNDATPHYPSSYAQPNIIAVAATDPDDARAPFSNYGATSVDIAAPGVNIYSTVPPARQNFGWNENFDSGAAVGWTLETWDKATTPPTQLAGNDDTVAVTSEDSVSAPNSLTDSPGGDYADNRSYRMISPAIDLSAEEGSVLNFSFNAVTELGFDYVVAETSTDGIVWTIKTLHTGDSVGWHSAIVALDDSATSRFRFRLETNGSTTSDGIHLDDISITVANTSGPHTPATDYQFFHGTSMAAPHVAGLAALVMAADPALTHLQVRNHVIDNGDVRPTLAGTTVTGRRINAQMSMPLYTPTGLNATAISYSQVNLSWTDNSMSEENYLVQRNSGSGFATIATLPADTTSYSDTNAPSSTTLSYRSVARARDGRTVTSTAATATTPAAPPPPASGGGGGGVFGPIGLALLLPFLFLNRRRRLTT